MAVPQTPRNVLPGRHVAAYEGDLVVFLVGMRINRWRALRHWPWVAASMGPMLRELVTDPASGLLGYRSVAGWRELTVVQYWRDAESLQAYAGDPSRQHRPAWLKLFRTSFASGSVGFWHETYVVPAGAHETIYVNMPRRGLGAVAGLVPVGRRGDSFDDRLARPLDRSQEVG